jgi:hypothetical protein
LNTYYFQEARDVISAIGPRFNPEFDVLRAWKGRYSRSMDVKFFMPAFTWETKVKLSRKPKMTLENHETNRNTIRAVLSIIPSTWISDDFRHIAVPPTAEFYFVCADPKTKDFEGYHIPDENTWAEYDVCCYPRRNGCMFESF